MERISVAIRARPVNEEKSSHGNQWKIENNCIALCNSYGIPVSGLFFAFDNVYDATANTERIYGTSIKDIIASAIQGFNGTVFAYGQTSSGKTHTMLGSSEEPGIIPLAVRDIFAQIEQMKGREFLLCASYVEIYNEKVNDLLDPSKQSLKIVESPEHGIHVAGRHKEIVRSPEALLELLKQGQAHRRVGSTNMNEFSSRSHTIFQLVIESRDKGLDEGRTTPTNDAVRVSTLNLVDLGGSERTNKTGAVGVRRIEGALINKSLLTLGTVIQKLSEGSEKNGGHVPYRQSKLTRILQPALGGNAKTVIICNINPSLVHVEETKGTLQFASRAKRVNTCAQINEVMSDAALLSRQKKEIDELRARLQIDNSYHNADHLEEELLNLRKELLKHETEKEMMALQLQEEREAREREERRNKEALNKITNLSLMVLNSGAESSEKQFLHKRNERRETWCPRPLHAAIAMPLPGKENEPPWMTTRERRRSSRIHFMTPLSESKEDRETPESRSSRGAASQDQSAQVKELLAKVAALEEEKESMQAELENLDNFYKFSRPFMRFLFCTRQIDEFLEEDAEVQAAVEELWAGIYEAPEPEDEETWAAHWNKLSRMAEDINFMAEEMQPMADDSPESPSSPLWVSPSTLWG